MANYREGNVVFVDTTDAAFPSVKFIKSIKYIGSASGTATVKGGGVTGGDIVWEESGAANAYNAEVNINDTEGVFVQVTNGAKVYLYLS